MRATTAGPVSLAPFPKMSEPLVSVALCTYNGAEFLEAQLRSILEQTRPVDEVVICDDGSTDDTAAVVARVAAATSTRIVFEINPNKLGITRNFERAISLTRGDLIFLSDQDDLWYPTKVRDMLAAFARDPDLQLLHTDARLVNQAGTALGATLFDALELTPIERQQEHDGDAFDAFLRRNLVTGATAAFRRELFEAARPFPAEWLHDEWLAIIGAAIGRVDFLDFPLIDYRQHDHNQVGMRPRSWRDKLQRVVTARGDYHRRLQRRAEMLLRHLQKINGRIKRCREAQVREKFEHARVRSQLPSARLARIPIVLREIASGRYRRCSTGWRSIARDLIERIDPASSSMQTTRDTP